MTRQYGNVPSGLGIAFGGTAAFGCAYAFVVMVFLVFMGVL